MIEVKMLGKFDIKGYTFIEGFPGAGLVGPMSISYMIDKLKMEYIGCIESESFPPLVSIHRAVPMPPIRVYMSREKKVVTIFAEFAIALELISELSNAVYAFINKSGISRIYSIGGIPTQPQPGANAPNSTVYVAASKPALLSTAQKAGFKPIEEGVSTGVGALLLLKSTMDKMDNINVMVPVQQMLVDPVYAEIAIECLNKLLKLDIDITDLEKEAKAVEAKIRELIDKHRESHESYKKSAGDLGPSMYA
jgi:uncharacterized protein